MTQVYDYVETNNRQAIDIAVYLTVELNDQYIINSSHFVLMRIFPASQLDCKSMSTARKARFTLKIVFNAETIFSSFFSNQKPEWTIPLKEAASLLRNFLS